MAEQGYDLLKKVDRSHLRQQFADGLDELVMGMDMVVMGAVLHIMTLAFRQQIDPWWATGALLMPVAISHASVRVKERIRQRVTYPRIGYVSDEGGEPLSRIRRWVLWFFLVHLTLALMFVALLWSGKLPDLRTASEWGRWFPAVFGVLAWAAYWWDANRSGLSRIRVSGVIVAVVGIVASLASSDIMSASILFFMAWGSINITAGGVALWRFSAAAAGGTP